MNPTHTSLLLLLGLSGIAGSARPGSLKRANILFVFADDRGWYAGCLMKELTRAGDPRVTLDPPRFEKPPFTLP
jgi:hypothetical protein